jgi:hypothetical protein
MYYIYDKLFLFPKVVNIAQDALFVATLKDLVQEGVQVLPNYIYIYTHTCVCVCVYIYM